MGDVLLDRPDLALQQQADRVVLGKSKATARGRRSSSHAAAARLMYGASVQNSGTLGGRCRSQQLLMITMSPGLRDPPPLPGAPP
jgi:hypothetical protein